MHLMNILEFNWIRCNTTSPESN